MESHPSTPKSHNEYIDFICDNVDDLTLQDRRELRNILLESFIDRGKIREKANGLQIMTKDIPKEIIPNMYSFVQQRLNGYCATGSS